MTFFHFLVQFIDHFFQRFHLTGKNRIFLFKYTHCCFYNIFHCPAEDIQFCQCFVRKSQFFLIKFPCCSQDIPRMVRNTFKISDAVKHNGQIMAVPAAEIFLIQFHQIGTQFVLVTVYFLFCIFYKRSFFFLIPPKKGQCR